jgi:hypothetical protein
MEFEADSHEAQIARETLERYSGSEVDRRLPKCSRCL